MTKHSNANLGQHASRGMLWLAGQSLITKAFATGSQLILANLLSKEDFGTVGLTYSVTSIVAIFVNPGIDTVLIHRGKKFKQWSNAGVWLGVICGLCAALVMIAAAPVASSIYKNPRLIGMISILALATPLNAISIVPNALLSSQLRFHVSAKLTVINVAITSILSVTLAYLGFGSYSFVIPVPIASLVTSIITWRIAKPVVKFEIPYHRILALLSDSIYMLISRLMATSIMQGSYTLLGLFYSEKIVGIYYFGHMFSIQVVTFTGGKVNTVLLPALTKLPDHQKQAYAGLRAVQILSVVAIPLCILQAICARPILHLLYGSKWDDAAIVIEILSIALAVDVLAWPASAILQAQGKFKLQLKIWISGLCICLPLVFLGAYFGSYIGASIGFGAYMVIQSYIWNHMALVKNGITVSKIIKTYIIPITINLISGIIAILSYQPNLPQKITGNIMHIVLLIFIFSTVCLLLYYLFYRIPLHDTIFRFKKLGGYHS